MRYDFPKQRKSWTPRKIFGKIKGWYPGPDSNRYGIIPKDFLTNYSFSCHILIEINNVFVVWTISLPLNPFGGI